MAKGLAVVSGSSDVVFKALETGVVTIGSATTDASITVTGSLSLSGSTDPLKLEGLTSSAVSDAADDIVVIDSSGVVKRVQKLSASDVQLTDGQTVQDFSGSVDGRLDSLESSVGTGTLTISGSTESESVDLAAGSVQFLGTASETDVTVTTSSAGNVVVTVGLVPDVTVNTLTASNGLLVSNGGASVVGNVSSSADLIAAANLNVAGTASIDSTLDVGSTSTFGGTVTVSTGDITASAGGISGSGALQVGGNATIGGNLTVAGDFLVEGSVTTIDTTNLTVEDAIILVGSGSDAETGELGIVFGSTNGKSLSLNAGEFYLGSTTDNTLDGNIDPDNDGTGILHLGTLSASVGLEVAGSTSLNGSVTLGDASSDTITINGFITGSGSPIVVSSSLTVGDAGNVNNEVTTFVSQVRMPIYTISGDALEGTFPAIPSAYISSPSAQGGHMFYLTASTNAGTTEFPEANKWYMNERGVWHESFFFNE